MKWFILSFLLMAGMISCSKTEDVSSDLLYRKWRMTQILYTNQQPVDVSPTNPWSIVAFTSNGMILYGDDGKYDSCCSPTRFKRKGATLDLVDVDAIPIPERTPNPICAQVSCASLDSAWQIVTLTLNQLVIKQSRGTVTYQLYP